MSLESEFSRWLDDLPEGAELFGPRGWSRSLFAVKVGPEGVEFRSHAGESRTATDLLSLLEQLSPGEITALGFKEPELRARSLLESVATLPEDTPVSELAAILDRARDLLGPGSGPPPHFETPARVSDLAGWLRFVAADAARLLGTGEAERVRVMLSEATRAQRATSPLCGFIWPCSPGDLDAAMAACADLPEVTAREFLAEGAGWQVLSLPEPVPHPAGGMVDRVPVPPDAWLAKIPRPPDASRHFNENGRIRAAYRHLGNWLLRLLRLRDLNAPAESIAEAQGAIAEAVTAIVENARRPPASGDAGIVWLRRHVGELRLQEPPEGGRIGVFRIPFDNERFLVQTPTNMFVLRPDGIEYAFPPCPWPARFGSGEYVVFTDEVVSGETPLACAVLNLNTGTWCTVWPDEPGPGKLHTCTLPESDGHGAHWLVDPRTGRSWVLPGPVLSFNPYFGCEVLVNSPEGPLLAGPVTGGTDVLPLSWNDDWTAFRANVDTGEVTVLAPGTGQDADWQPLAEPHWACAITRFGEVIVARHGAVYVGGKRTLILDGQVLAMAVEVGNSTRNCHVAVLTQDAVLSLYVEAPEQDDDGEIRVVNRIELPGRIPS